MHSATIMLRPKTKRPKDVMAKVLEKPYDRWSILITFIASRIMITTRSSQIKMSLGAKRAALDLPRPWETLLMLAMVLTVMKSVNCR